MKLQDHFLLFFLFAVLAICTGCDSSQAEIPVFNPLLSNPPDENHSQQSDENLPEEGEQPLTHPKRQAKDPKSLSSDPPAFSLNTFSGVPERDGCQRADIKIDGKLIRSQYYYYNKLWKLKAKQVIDPQSDYYFQTEYHYNDKDQLEEMRSFHHGTETFRHVYQYDENGRLAKQQWLEWGLQRIGTEKEEKRKFIVYENQFHYDKKGRLIKRVQYLDDRPGTTIENDYDQAGRMTKHKKSYAVPGEDPETGYPIWDQVVSEVGEYQYDKLGNLEAVTLYRPVAAEQGGKLSIQDLGEIRYQYRNGRLIREEHRLANKTESFTLAYDYDVKGRLIKQVRSTSRRKETTIYKYD